MDKFFSLVRKMVCQSLRYLDTRSWEVFYLLLLDTAVPPVPPVPPPPCVFFFVPAGGGRNFHHSFQKENFFLPLARKKKWSCIHIHTHTHSLSLIPKHAHTFSFCAKKWNTTLDRERESCCLNQELKKKD